MPRIIQKVSREMIQAIEGERLSRDQIIYYDNEHGWIYQQRDDDFINSVSRAMEENSQNDLENRPLEKLGPFGKFRLFDNYGEKTCDQIHIFRYKTN